MCWRNFSIYFDISIQNNNGEIIYSTSQQGAGATYGGHYVPSYGPPNLKWFEKYGLMTYIDQLKYHEFASNPNKWLKHHQAVNFDIIHNRCRIDKLDFDLKYYQTVTKSYVRSYPETEK